MPRRRRQHDTSNLPRRVRATAAVAGVAAAVGLAVAGPASRAADPCTSSWDGGAGTSRWGDRGNWTGDRLPGADDVACIGAGADVQLDGPDAAVAGLRVDGGLTIATSDLEVLGSRESAVTGTLTITTGRLIADGQLAVASLRQSGGAVVGPGTVATPDLRWTGGLEQGDGTTEVVAGGPGATIAGARHTLDNARTLRIDAGASAAWTAGNLTLGGSSRLVNAGLFDIDGEPDLLGCCGTAQQVVNEAGGTLRKRGAGTTELGYPMANDGAVEVAGGTLALEGGSVVGRPSAGSFAIDDGAVLDLPSGDVSFDEDSSFVGHGSGEVRVTGAAARFAGSLDAPLVVDDPAAIAFVESSVTVPRVRLARGKLSGAGTLATQDFTWTGGTQAGAGTTRILAGGPGLALAGPAAGLLALERRLEIAPDATAGWTGGDLGVAGDAVLDNAGLLDLRSDAQLEVLCCGAAALVENEPGATIRKTASDGRSTIGASLQNDGTLEAGAGTLELAGGLANLSGGELRGGRYLVGATLAVADAHIAANAAEVVLDGPGSRIEDATGADALRDLASNLPGGDLTLTGGRALAPAGDLANDGRVTLAEGAALAPAGSYRQSDGLTALTAADASIRTGAGAHLLGGALTGSGTVDGDLENAAVVDPGAASSTLTVTGDYSQPAAGTLVAHVGTAGVPSLLDVAGRAELAGTLRIETAGYEPSADTAIQLIRHGSEAGEFDTVLGLAPDADHSYPPPDYPPDGVWLRTGTTPTAAIGDAVVSEGDGGDATASLQVTLDQPPTRTVRLDWRTIDGSATSPADFAASSGTVTIPHGQATAEISVAVHGDTVDEPDETFAVELTAAANATLGRDRGTATILDDDAPSGGPPPPGGPPPGGGPPPSGGPPPVHRPPHGHPRPRRCVDHRAPRSRIVLARARRHHLVLRGRARDFGCARLRRVRVWVALHLKPRRPARRPPTGRPGHPTGKPRRPARARCRFLKPNRRLSRPRPCAKRIWIVARGTRRWRLEPKHRLPRGRYTVRSQAVDRARNRERRRTRRNTRAVVLR